MLDTDLDLHSEDDFLFNHLVKKLEKLIFHPDYISDISDLDSHEIDCPPEFVTSVNTDLDSHEIDYSPEFVTSVIDFFDGNVEKANYALQNLPPIEQKPSNTGSLIACMRQALPDVSYENLDLAFILAHFNFIEGIKLLQTPKNDRIPCEKPALSIPKSHDKEDKIPEEIKCPECHKIMDSSRKPVILFPCGHTVCSFCVKSNCPICKKSIQKKQKNFELLSAVEKFLKYESFDNCMVCQICYREMDSYQRPITLLPCGHTLCHKCFNHWDRCICPFCRKFVEGETINHSILSIKEKY